MKFDNDSEHCVFFFAENIKMERNSDSYFLLSNFLSKVATLLPSFIFQESLCVLVSKVANHSALLAFSLQFCLLSFTYLYFYAWNGFKKRFY